MEYKNHETFKRNTQCGVRDLTIVHSADELEIYEQLHDVFINC